MTFIPNAINTPVVWLVQSNCVIEGYVYVSGQSTGTEQGGSGGPGGYRGGNGAPSVTGGQGPGGGNVGYNGGNGSYGSVGASPAGPTYGNAFLIPLLGGSGGGGSTNFSAGGGGGGGAVLIAASGVIQISGYVGADGGYNTDGGRPGGGGSGGAVRLVAARIAGTGFITASGGYGSGSFNSTSAGKGRVRFDCFENAFSGVIDGVFTQGFQPIIIPTAGQGAQLTVTSVGGVPVSASPTGTLSTPDAVLSAQQNDPIPIVIHCSNIPLNTQITVSVKPANGTAVSATGLNSSGTLSSNTATVLINMPRGGGLIYATAATGN